MPAGSTTMRVSIRAITSLSESVRDHHALAGNDLHQTLKLQTVQCLVNGCAANAKRGADHGLVEKLHPAGTQG